MESSGATCLFSLCGPGIPSGSDNKDGAYLFWFCPLVEVAEAPNGVGTFNAGRFDSFCRNNSGADLFWFCPLVEVTEALNGAAPFNVGHFDFFFGNNCGTSLFCSGQPTGFFGLDPISFSASKEGTALSRSRCFEFCCGRFGSRIMGDGVKAGLLCRGRFSLGANDEADMFFFRFLPLGVETESESRDGAAACNLCCCRTLAGSDLVEATVLFLIGCFVVVAPLCSCCCGAGKSDMGTGELLFFLGGFAVKMAFYLCCFGTGISDLGEVAFLFFWGCSSV